jgi:hypothetical protein
MMIGNAMGPCARVYAVNLAGRLLSSSVAVGARTLKNVGSNARIA